MLFICYFLSYCAFLLPRFNNVHFLTQVYISAPYTCFLFRIILPSSLLSLQFSSFLHVTYIFSQSSLSFSFSFSLTLSLPSSPLCLSIFLSDCLYVLHSFYPSIIMSLCLSSLSIRLSVLLSFCLSAFLSFCLCVSVFLSVFLCLSFYFSVFLSFSLAVFLPLFLFVFLSLFFCLSVSFCLPVCLCVWLSVCLSLSSSTHYFARGLTLCTCPPQSGRPLLTFHHTNALKGDNCGLRV